MGLSKSKKIPLPTKLISIYTGTVLLEYSITAISN